MNDIRPKSFLTIMDLLKMRENRCFSIKDGRPQSYSTINQTQSYQWEDPLKPVNLFKNTPNYYKAA